MLYKFQISVLITAAYGRSPTLFSLDANAYWRSETSCRIHF